MQEILGGGLGLRVLGDDIIEIQQFYSVRIGEGWSNLALFKGFTLRFTDKEPGGQLANVGRVILDTDLFGLTIDGEMGIEATVVIDAGFKGEGEALIVKEGGQKEAPLSGRNHPPRHTEQSAHGGEIMAAQATEQTIGGHQLRGSIPDGGLDQAAGTLGPIAHRPLWNILWAQHDTGLLHKLGILTNNIAHSGIVDLLESAYLLDSLDKGWGIATHVAHHDLDAGLITGFDDRLRLLARQAHGFLNQNMFAMLNSGQGGISMIFIAIQDEDGVQIFLFGQILNVEVTVFGRDVIAPSQCGEPFRAA